MIKLLRVPEACAKKPRAASMADAEGVAEKVAVKPWVAGEIGKLTR